MLRMEIARLFGVLPHELLRLPLSEFRLLARYYRSYRRRMEGDPDSGPGPGDTVLE
jgi:hypothetical protein